MSDQQPEKSEETPVDELGIVSVNSRGVAAHPISGKTVVVVALVASLLVGGALSANRYRQERKAEDAIKRLAANDSRKSGESTRRRIFNTEPPPIPAEVPITKSLSHDAQRKGCVDGQPGGVAASDDTVPLEGAGLPGDPCNSVKTGDQITMQTPADNAPSISPAPGSLALPARGRTGTTADRFGGDVLLPSRRVDGVSASFDPDTPYLKAMLQSAVPSSRAPSGDTDGGSAPAAFAVPVQASTISSAQGSFSKPSQGGAIKATLIGNRDMILPEGRTIDCNLSVRLISEVSGKATCVLSSDVYSDNGKVVLAERGSTAIGEYTANISQGQRRLFIVWTRLETPHGVVVNLDSPAADALGTSGLPGYVDNRWRERIGAAVLLSLVEDAIGYQTAKTSSANGNGGAQGVAAFQNTTQNGQHLAERILDSTINIKPTIYKHQGDRATIFVSRDLDFGGVYALRAK